MDLMDTKTQEELARTNKGYDGIPDSLADLHSTRPTQVVLISSRREIFTPKSSIDTGSFVKIQIQGGQNEFIDISETLLWIKMKIVASDGSDLGVDAEGGKCVFVNGIGSALFKNLGVRLNNQPISTEDGYYAYRADLENKFFTKSEEKTDLRDAGHFEEKKIFEDLAENHLFGNGGLDEAIKARHLKCKGSQQVEFCSRLFSPIFDQHKPLPPGSQLELNFERNSDAFCLLSKQKGNKIQLLEMGIEIKFDKADSEVVNEMFNITKKDPFKYQLRRAVITPFTKGPNLHSFSLQNVFSANHHLPRKIIMAIVDQLSEQGDRGRDPFAYKDYNISSCKLVVGGVTKPLTELDSTLKKLRSMRRVCDSMLGGKTNGFTLDSYKTRNNVVGWDLSPIGSAPLSSFHLDSTENVQIDIKLSEPNTEAVTILIYAEYEAEMLLDGHGTILNQEFAL